MTRPLKQHGYILIGLHVTNTVTLLWVNWDGSDKTCSKTPSRRPSPTSQQLLLVVEAVSLNRGYFHFMLLDDFLQSSVQILLLLL